VILGALILAYIGVTLAVTIEFFTMNPSNYYGNVSSSNISFNYTVSFRLLRSINLLDLALTLFSPSDRSSVSVVRHNPLVSALILFASITVSIVLIMPVGQSSKSSHLCLILTIAKYWILY
jgi:hypothetical protein